MPSQLRRTAEIQHGLLSRRDLLDAGLTSRQIRLAGQRGDLEPLGRRTHRMPGTPRTPQQALLAACMETGGVASHRSAAWLHRLGATRPPVPPEVLVARPGRREIRPIATLHTTTWLPSDDVVMVDGIPTTGVARTLFGLAGLVPEIDVDLVRDLVGEAVRDRKATDPWLWWRLEKLRCRGRSGVSVFEEILQARAGGLATESWLERQFLLVLERAGLPLPECQQRISRRGSFLARVDFLYADRKLIIEVSGYAAHGSPAQIAADVRRRNALVLEGYTFLEFTYDHVVRDPAYVAREVASSLALPMAA